MCVWMDVCVDVQSLNGTSSASNDSKIGTEVYEVMLQCRFSRFFDSAARGPARAKKLHFFGILGRVYLLPGAIEKRQKRHWSITSYTSVPIFESLGVETPEI